MRKYLCVFIILFFTPVLCFATALDLPQDANGWTVFSTASDTRIMYVAAAGNDSTGTVYTSANHPDWSSPFNPTGTINAYATYAAAYANTRAGYPDWVLFKRGDTFYQAIGGSVRSGRSDTEPFLIGSYGASGLSPLLKTGSSAGISIALESPSSPGTYEYIAVFGLRFYAHTRNPDDPEYVSNAGTRGLSVSAHNTGNTVKNIHIESCAFLFPANNVLQATGGANRLADIAIRRNVFFKSYPVSGHAQGIMAAAADRVLIEENIFDHNGWLVQDGSGTGAEQATFHKHNMYIDGINDLTIRGNISSRASSIGTKIANEMSGLLIDNNLYIDNELGIDACNNYHDSYYRMKSPTVSNNIFYNHNLSRPTDRSVMMIMWIQGWDGGTIENNLTLGNDNNAGGGMGFYLGTRSRNTVIKNNLTYMHNVGEFYPVYANGTTNTGVVIQDNYFEISNTTYPRVWFGVEATSTTLSGNQWYHPDGPVFRWETTNYDTNYWTANIEPTATYTQKTFTAPTRTVETYLTSKGETATLSNFYTLAVAQDRYDWDTNITAEEINDYLRAGFDMELVDGGDDDPSISAPSGLRVVGGWSWQ